MSNKVKSNVAPAPGKDDFSINAPAAVVVVVVFVVVVAVVVVVIVIIIVAEVVSESFVELDVVT